MNNAVVDIVRNVINRPDGRRTIFYIEGDHGPGSRLDWEDPSKTDARERLAILMAARFPNPSPESKLPAWITPVNSFRRMLNEALGTRLPLLEDHSYFSRWNDPLGLIEVTDRVR